jgi:hypothetical protein
VDVADVDPGLVRDRVGHRTDQAQLRVAREVTKQRRGPAARDDRVVVQKNQEFPSRRGEAGVDGRGVAAIFAKEDRPNSGIFPGHRVQQIGGSVLGTVVHDDDLEVGPLGARANAFEAEAIEVEIAVGDDHDGDQGKRLGQRRRQPDRGGPVLFSMKTLGQALPGGVGSENESGGVAALAAKDVESLEGGFLRRDDEDPVARFLEGSDACFVFGRDGRQDEEVAAIIDRHRRGARRGPGGPVGSHPVALPTAQPPAQRLEECPRGHGRTFPVTPGGTSRSSKRPP